MAAASCPASGAAALGVACPLMAPLLPADEAPNPAPLLLLTSAALGGTARAADAGGAPSAAADGADGAAVGAAPGAAPDMAGAMVDTAGGAMGGAGGAAGSIGRFPPCAPSISSRSLTNFSRCISLTSRNSPARRAESISPMARSRASCESNRAAHSMRIGPTERDSRLAHVGASGRSVQRLRTASYLSLLPTRLSSYAPRPTSRPLSCTRVPAWSRRGRRSCRARRWRASGWSSCRAWTLM